MYPPPAIPRLVAVCGRDGKAADEAAGRYGYEDYYTNWHKMLETTVYSSLTMEGPTMCTPSRAFMTGFNYRLVPAVRLAHDLIASGALGRVYHLRAVYLADFLMPFYGRPWAWRSSKSMAGSGALGDMASTLLTWHVSWSARSKA